jgi:hypothetical protein
MFLPRRQPHAFLIASEEVHLFAFVTPGGFFDAINKMNVRAEQMDIPIDVGSLSARCCVSIARNALGTRIIRLGFEPVLRPHADRIVPPVERVPRERSDPRLRKPVSR